MPNNFDAAPRANERMLAKLRYKCAFCRSENIDKSTVTCLDCGTTLPGLRAPRRKPQRAVREQTD